MTDPAALTADLIRCPSVTPEEAGALTMLSDLLSGAGFDCIRVDRNGTPNLFARWGEKGAKCSFGFNGHTDVVPPGDPGSWTYPPFSGHVDDEGTIWGRGATDMKSGVAAFVAAAIDFVRETPPDGAIILTITGDEEGAGRDGTLALLDWMEDQGEAMSVCVVGEPSNPETFGEMIKIGRRGSVTYRVTAHGIQGHVAYPDRVRNPLHALVRFLDELTDTPLDDGSAHFDPSGLQVTTIDCGNAATNVVPETATAVFNIRFNDLHTADRLDAEIQALAARISAETGVAITLIPNVSGESFLTEPGPFVDLVRSVVEAETGIEPVLSTTGGTSDARFVKDHCPVLEFGLVGRFMHQVDERVPSSEIHALKRVYQRILGAYFA
ncbi:succinyl-diaminopimelate desuccinylase [Paracoccus sp. SCSIO 75233]|uniref:succinyl-diaminopimelate desuccinylase n=1 Tax=Paracoccus sp. SCSIO 75233 TaxID=3017782 RepID=UPI0022F0143A|nr:succinyl-diaminopimelate desuccinylase [Paracoccus sp. SCSIO 75233]WBU53786.1 succinyl-diaminopimelate desuccinylase [Paracoccus sp. SCSIO 75233]